VNLRVLRISPVSAILDLQTAVQNRSTVTPTGLYGLHITGGDIAADALCVSYNDMLASSSTLPAKLRRCRDTDHPVC
jgi:hypothetical protein